MSGRPDDPFAMRAPPDPFGAFCRENHVALLGSGRGPLCGLRFAVKDVFHVAGHRTGFGNPRWLETHPPATETAAAVRRLLDAGADMVGKTHTDELAYSLTGENVHYGTPSNPRDPKRIPGGSSNGSVVAVAGGLADFALGTDCGGSVRLPASYCGVLGIRPTHGRVPLDGVIPFGPSFDVVGWFARDPEILRRVASVLLDPARPAVAPRRLLIARDAFDRVEAPVSEALADRVRVLADRIGASTEAVVSPPGLPAWVEVFRVIQAGEIWANHGEWVRSVRPCLGPGIRERFEWAATVSPEELRRSRAEHERIALHLDRLLREEDVLCMPTSPRVAPRRNTPTDEIEITYRHQAMCLLCVAGLGGLPQVSLPLAELDGLPLGLSILGRRAQVLGCSTWWWLFSDVNSCAGRR